MFNFMQPIQGEVSRREHQLPWRHGSLCPWLLDGFLDFARVSGFCSINTLGNQADWLTT